LTPSGLELEHRDDGSRVHRHDATQHTEVGELLLEDPRVMIRLSRS